MFAVHKNRKVDSGKWSLVLFGFEWRACHLIPCYEVYNDGYLDNSPPKHIARRLLKRAFKRHVKAHYVALSARGVFGMGVRKSVKE